MDLISLLLSTPGLFVLLLLLSVLYVYNRFGYAPYFYFSSQNIPGPKPKPLIGNLNLITKFEGDTIAMSTHLVKTYGPVCGVYFGTKPFLHITDLDMIRDVTARHFDKFVDHFDSTIGLKVNAEGKSYDVLFTVSGNEWRKRRHFVSPAFSAHKVKLMEPLIKESTVRLVKKLSESADKGEAVETLNLFSMFTIEVFLSTAFGRSLDVQGGQGGEIYEDVRDLFQHLSGKQAMAMKIMQFFSISFPRVFILLQPLIKLSGAFRSLPRLTEAAINIVQLRKREGNANSRKDLLQLLIDASAGETDKGLCTAEIVTDTVGFLFAGQDPISVALTFAIYTLAANPEVQERVANEIHDYWEENSEKSMYEAMTELEYLDMFLCETLRMYPPAPATIRLCNEECVVNGVTVKPGVQVYIPIYDVHMNPEIYPDPEKFIPERFTPEEKAKRHPCAYFPFGLGPRNCLGMRFALMEAKMALIEVVRNFKIELSPETKVPLETEVEMTLRPKNGLHVVFHWRN